MATYWSLLWCWCRYQYEGIYLWWRNHREKTTGSLTSFSFSSLLLKHYFYRRILYYCSYIFLISGLVVWFQSSYFGRFRMRASMYVCVFVCKRRRFSVSVWLLAYNGRNSRTKYEERLTSTFLFSKIKWEQSQHESMQ